jgi:hypothetical protein
MNSNADHSSSASQIVVQSNRGGVLSWPAPSRGHEPLVTCPRDRPDQRSLAVTPPVGAVSIAKRIVTSVPPAAPADVEALGRAGHQRQSHTKARISGWSVGAAVVVGHYYEQRPGCDLCR